MTTAFWFILAMYCNGPVCGIAPYGSVRYEHKIACEHAADKLNYSFKNAHAKCEEGKS